MKLENETERKPDFVNAQGIKWWFSKSSTEYGERVGCKNTAVWITEHPDGTKTRVIVKDKEVVYDNGALEAIGARLDMIGFLDRQKDNLLP